MARLHSVIPEGCSGQTRTLMNGIAARFGKVPNTMRILANSPAALEAYLGFGRALERACLPERLREAIALAVSEHNACHYCISQHDQQAAKLGLDDRARLVARLGHSLSPRYEAAIHFALELLHKRGAVDDGDLARLRAENYSDGEIVEILAVTQMTQFANYLNHLALTDIDFPAAPTLEPH